MARNFFAAASVLALSLIASAAAMEKSCPINAICFVMDRSGSMRGFYDQEQKFVVDISRTIAARTSDTKYSAHGFAGSAFVISSSTTDLEGKFIPAINKPVSPKGSTNMYRGMNACYRELKDMTVTNRVIVLITDGDDTGNPRALDDVQKIKNSGISIVSVGIGNNVDKNYLENLATKQDLFIASSFANLSTNVVKVAENSCKAPMMTPTPVKPTPKPVVLPTMPEPTTNFAACQNAYNACGFKFDGRMQVPTFSVLGAPDRSISPIIISKKANQKIGVLNTNDIIPEFILTDGSAKNITLFAKPRFTPTHFKPYSIAKPMPNLNMTMYGSGVGHQTFHGTQKSLARKRCVRLFFTTYQVLSNGMKPYVTGNVNVKKSDMKCVVFLTN